MLKALRGFITISLIIVPCISFAVDYPYKKVDDFKKLESYKSVEQFEANYKKYVQHCLDNTGGGTGGIPCFIGYELWDRELNIYYNNLMSILGEKEKKILKESQRVWIKEKQKTIEFNSVLLDKKYTEMGTMYVLMRVGNVEETITPIVKNRALLMKKWFEAFKEKK